MDYKNGCFASASKAYNDARKVYAELPSGVPDDVSDRAFLDLSAAVDQLVRSPAATLQQLHFKLIAIETDGDWMRHGRAIIRDLEGLVA